MKLKLEHPKLKEGFLMRPGSLDDAQATLEMLQACSMVMTGKKESSLEDLKNDWTSPRFNPETDLRVVISPEGKLVGCMEVWAVHKVPVHPWAWGRVHPEYEGLGIGSAMMDWAEERARKAIAKVPAQARVSMRSSTLTSYQPAKDLLDGPGMNLIRHSFRMRIEMLEKPPDPQWSQGISLRAFDGSDEMLKAVYLADEEAFRDHFGHVEEPFDSGFKRFKHYFVNGETYDPALWFLAMDGDEIAGISLCQKWSWHDKEVGWVASLAVRRPWRKRGIGLALLQHSFQAYWDRGMPKVGLGVDAENLTGALRLYEKAGMRVHQQDDLYEIELRPGEELSKVSLEE